MPYKKTKGTRQILRHNIRYCTWTSGITDYRGQRSSGTASSIWIKILPTSTCRKTTERISGGVSRQKWPCFSMCNCRTCGWTTPPQGSAGTPSTNVIQHMSPCCHIMVAHMSQKERQRYKRVNHCHFLGPNQQDPIVQCLWRAAQHSTVSEPSWGH